MGSGLKKNTTYDMGTYIPSKKEQEASMWCIKNGIYISPKAESTSSWRLVIEINKKANTSPESYKKVEVWKQLFKYYIYYYDKYRNAHK